jgi:hypothetical protein
LFLVGLAQSADQFRTGGDERVFVRIGLHHRAVDMEQAAIDQTGLHALANRQAEEPFKNAGAPTRPGFGEHAVVGDLRIQIKA